MTPEQVIERLNEIGEWTSDKMWEQHPIAAEAQRVIKRLVANHKDAVATKRVTDARLKAALGALQRVYNVSRDGFEDATHERPRASK